MEFSVKSKRRQGCDNGTGPFFGGHHLRLVLFLFAIDAVLQGTSLVFDGDLSGAGLSDFDVGVAHGISSAFGLDLIDHIVVGKRQVL